MNKLVVFIFLILLFGGCNKGWNEDRDVDFGITYDISWDPLDLPNGFAEFRWIIEYKKNLSIFLNLNKSFKRINFKNIVSTVACIKVRKI